MINYTILDRYIDNLTSEELHSYMKLIANNVNKLYKQKIKALEAEINTDAYCSRAKRTTLVAKSYNITQAYNAEITTLKHIINRLWNLL